jgi:hypothetical protein
MKFLDCPYFPDYGQYIEQRRSSGQSTTRKDYFYAILLSLSEDNRCELVQRILDRIQDDAAETVAEVRKELGGLAAVPMPRMSSETWNSDRLNRYLQEIDSRIAGGNYEGALTLPYTSLEGCFKAFLHQRVPAVEIPDDMIELAKMVRSNLRDSIKQYPDEALALLTHVAHMVDRTRNQFSESHFDKEADRWLAVFARDLVNSEIRLPLYFMKERPSPAI